MPPQYLTDGIHPNDAGHQAMADFIDLRLLTDD
jgi:lysophospholipase L1-like esterase